MHPETSLCCAPAEIDHRSPLSIAGVQYGRDTSGNFALSFDGLAVRTSDNRFVVFKKEEKTPVRLLDVTGFTLATCDEFVYRVPVRTPSAGQLLLRSDCPFEVVYVEEFTGKKVKGVLASGEEVNYLQPERLGECTQYVRIATALELSGDEHKLNLGLLTTLLCQRSACDPLSNAVVGAVISQLVQGAEPEERESIAQQLLLLTGPTPCIENFFMAKVLRDQKPI